MASLAPLEDALAQLDGLRIILAQKLGGLMLDEAFWTTVKSKATSEGVDIRDRAALNAYVKRSFADLGRGDRRE